MCSNGFWNTRNGSGCWNVTSCSNNNCGYNNGCCGNTSSCCRCAQAAFERGFALGLEYCQGDECDNSCGCSCNHSCC